MRIKRNGKIGKEKVEICRWRSLGEERFILCDCSAVLDLEVLVILEIEGEG